MKIDQNCSKVFFIVIKINTCSSTQFLTAQLLKKKATAYTKSASCNPQDILNYGVFWIANIAVVFRMLTYLIFQH